VRINSIQVKNFRAITSLQLSDLRDTVVIAGPNGCGKSCLFDAIRLLKSAYGGYQPNEMHHWFGEFQINVAQPGQTLLALFQDRSRPIEVEAEFSLSDSELHYLRANAEQILIDSAWKQVVPELAQWRDIRAASMAANLRVHLPRVQQIVAHELPILAMQLGSATHIGKLVIHPQGEGVTQPSRVLEIVFGRYDPQQIGIIDYHGATRNYAREQIGGINLSIESSDERARQHALYNYANKYANLKSEMAGSYVRQLLGRQADGVQRPDSLSDTLKELFTTFFPGKEFVGPKPTADGRLLFPVRTPSGSEHDIDELSSGEKEVLYGYLRLRNSSPRNSVLLLDEPELHLNPRLIRGLANFYHQHLGKPLGTQLWLVTHSDTLIREAVGQDGFSVYHLQPAGQYEGENQASLVQVGADVDRLIMELVGDLAAYRPGAKLVVFEGDSESEFDVRMTSTLFPEFLTKTNAVSGGNKHKVTQLYELLEASRASGAIPGRFYAITDADGDPPESGGAVRRRFAWDVYHIENYLLEPELVLRVLRDVHRATGALTTEVGVLEALRDCARETVHELVGHKLRVKVNHALVKSLDVGFDPRRRDVSSALTEALTRSRSRIEATLSGELNPENVQAEDRRFREQFEDDLLTGAWRRTFRGRDVLKRFVGRHVGGLSYEPFRELIISKMRDTNFQPPGMKRVIEAILSDDST